MNLPVPPAAVPMIELSGVTKRFGPTAALDAMDLTIPAGQTTALLGPSGCGKSTLLRLIVGLTTPDAGTITFAGEPVTRATLPALRRRVGYVIQEGGLFPHLTARQNVTLIARERGWAKDRIAERFAELMELTQLPPETADRYPVQLSGGQRQRVSLARALFLDPVIRRELQTQIRTILRAQARTAVLVTHDLAEAAYLADRLVLLSGGRIEQEGTPTDLIERPRTAFVRAFLDAQRGAIGLPSPA